jgi:hypothetical protein
MTTLLPGAAFAAALMIAAPVGAQAYYPYYAYPYPYYGYAYPYYGYAYPYYRSVSPGWGWGGGWHHGWGGGWHHGWGGGGWHGGHHR